MINSHVRRTEGRVVRDGSDYYRVGENAELR